MSRVLPNNTLKNKRYNYRGPWIQSFEYNQSSHYRESQEKFLLILPCMFIHQHHRVDPFAFLLALLLTKRFKAIITEDWDRFNRSYQTPLSNDWTQRTKEERVQDRRTHKPLTHNHQQQHHHHITSHWHYQIYTKIQSLTADCINLIHTFRTKKESFYITYWWLFEGKSRIAGSLSSQSSQRGHFDHPLTFATNVNHH